MCIHDGSVLVRLLIWVAEVAKGEMISKRCPCVLRVLLSMSCRMHLHANIFKELLHHHLPELSDHLVRLSMFHFLPCAC